MALGRRLFADANALYSTAARDILIDLALANIITLQWSDQVLRELENALLRTRKDIEPSRVRKLLDQMRSVLPDAVVTEPLDRDLNTDLLPDPNDAHVVAAAVAGQSDTLVTFNLRDFPTATLRAMDIRLTPVHPDVLFVNLIITQPADVLPVLGSCRKALAHPPVSIEQYCQGLARQGMPQTAALLRQLLPTLDVK